MVFGDTSPPSSQSAGFWNKAAIPCPNHSSLDLLAYCVGSSMSWEQNCYVKSGQLTGEMMQRGFESTGRERVYEVQSSSHPCQGARHVSKTVWGPPDQPHH